MQLRKRSPRFGTADYADACDLRPDDAVLVRVGRSGVCDGVGVFATRDVPANTVMTAYPFVMRGRYHGTRLTKSHDSDYEYEWDCDTSLDGHPDILAKLPPAKRKGLGHLTNDAIHREITGLDNNCSFLEDRDKNRPRLHLVTTCPVKRGQELLVSYWLGYWMHRTSVDLKMQKWIACHRRVHRAFPQLLLQEYMGAFEDEEEGYLLYKASCSPRTGCSVCGEGGNCAPRHVEIRWLAGSRGRKMACMNHR